MSMPQLLTAALVIECELVEILYQEHIHTIIGRVKNVSVDESVLDAQGKVDASKLGMIFFDSFSRGYFSLGNRVGDAWSVGRSISPN